MYEYSPLQAVDVRLDERLGWDSHLQHGQGAIALIRAHAVPKQDVVEGELMRTVSRAWTISRSGVRCGPGYERRSGRDA